jgi:hypothetical protein
MTVLSFSVPRDTPGPETVLAVFCCRDALGGRVAVSRYRPGPACGRAGMANLNCPTCEGAGRVQPRRAAL